MKAFAHRPKLLVGLLLALAGVMGWVTWQAPAPPSVRTPPLQVSRPSLWPVVGAPVSGTLPIPAPAKPDPIVTRRVQTALGTLPLYFIANRGQLDERVAYYVQGRDTAVYFTAAGITFALTGPASQREADAPPRRAAVRPVSLGGAPDVGVTRQRWAITLEFLGANPDVKPVGHEPTPAVVSYFKGPREEWKAGLPTYASVVYSNLWPGIDLAFRGHEGALKYEFRIDPGANVGAIRMTQST